VIFQIKWTRNLLASRRHMKRISQAESDLCPSCLAIVKTAPHIFACKRHVEWQGTFIDSLRKVLAKTHTQPDLRTTLLLGVRGAEMHLPDIRQTRPPLDKCLFPLDLDKPLDETDSSEQAAWINLVTPTMPQAKTKADNHLRNAQRNVREFLL
jgi:hypothetical protein